jgi:hypothetical protein
MLQSQGSSRENSRTRQRLSKLLRRPSCMQAKCQLAATEMRKAANRWLESSILLYILLL